MKETKESFIRLIASKEGETITPALALQASDLTGEPNEEPGLEMFKAQAMMVMLGALGGEITIPVKVIDTQTRGQLMMMKATDDRLGITFWLEDKS